jgi:hypothetical protein
LYFDGCLKLMQGAQENHMSLREKENNLKTTKGWTIFEPKWKSNVLEKHEKTKNQRKQCAWKMKTLISKIKT